MQHRKPTAQATLAAATLALLLVAGVLAGPGLAPPPVPLEAAPVEPQPPTSFEDSGSSSTSETPPTVWTNVSEDWPVGCSQPLCFFHFEEYRYHNESHHRALSGAFAESRHDDLSGYYLDVLDGIVWARVLAGNTAWAQECANAASSSDATQDGLWNNLGYSEHHEQASRSATESSCDHHRRMSLLAADAALQAPVAGAVLDVSREQDGDEAYADHDASSSSSGSRDELVGVPTEGQEQRQGQESRRDVTRTWNSTSADGNVFLVNPRGSGVIDVVGLRAEKGDVDSDDRGEQRTSHGSAQEYLGFAVVEEDDATASSQRQTRLNEWLHLVVDLHGGTVRGAATYDRTSETDTRASSERDQTDVAGVPTGSQRASEETFTSAGRNVAFDLDAAQGMGWVHVASDDWAQTMESSSSEEAILGVPAGPHRENRWARQSDGVQLALGAGQGLLVLRLGYANSTYAAETVEDLTVDGEPTVGNGTFVRDEHRGVGAEAESTTGAYVGGGRDDYRHEEGGSLRTGGAPLVRNSVDDRGTRTGLKAEAPKGLLAADLLYAEGTKVTTFEFGGPAFQSEERYQRLDAGASGDADEVQGGLLSYRVRHTETRSDTEAFELGRRQLNVTQDEASVEVLQGLAGLSVSREFRTEQLDVGGFRAFDASLQKASASAHAGDASVDAGGTVLYGNLAGFLDGAVVEAHACADPGAAGQSGLDQALGAAPPAVAALVPRCDGGVGIPVGAPATVDACLQVLLADSLVVGAAMSVTGLLGPAQSIVQSALEVGHDAAFQAFLDAGGCRLFVPPTEARNPQPALAVLEAGEGAAATATAPAYPAYDAARHAAYGPVDVVMRLEKAVANPAGLPGV